VTSLFGFLMQKGRIPDAWFAAQVDQADRVDGDIDTLSGRIAQIRTWTFVANRPDWLADPEHWQGIAREVENKLSDALHERLTERFVDRRTSVLMRRLRENSVLNTEIGKTGEVIVEGHVIGRLDGFTFAPDAAEAGSDAKALAATAQKALAGEIDARAEKLAIAPDDQLLLTSDGTIRWTGDAVAKLVAAEDALHPRLRIIADERLNGASRDKVQARLDLWLKTHVEKLLGPLFDLTKAEDITGIARGIAFQLVEALGVLERAKIASEMKDLDQPSRASLRKYGVRFGAYHIYLPALLKPAARALASLLWALKADNVDPSVLSGAQHLASSGRTSFPVDKQLARDAYRVLGFRQCGERAVRVDILERLADLIRPALAWRQTSAGEKPAGAFDGRSFVVTQAMTSLTGSAGEDFASILRALGYRMELRPPLPPKPAVVEPVALPTPPLEAAAEAPAEAATEAPAETVAVETAAASPVSGDSASAALLPEVSPRLTVSEETPAVVEMLPEPAVAPEPAGASEPAAAEVATTPAAPEAAAVESAAEASAAEETAAALVEVWRPGGRSDERRPRHDRGRYRRDSHRPDGTQPLAATSEAGQDEKQGEKGDKPGEKREHHRRGRRHRDFNKPREGAPVEAAAPADGVVPAPVSEARADKPSRREPVEGKGGERDGERRRDKPQEERRGERKGGRDKGGREHGRDFGRDKGGGRDKRESGPSHRQYATSASPRERDRPIDPNSPFAKLAALKEQLTANRKD
jgi:ATP-dependent RNA helicase SUPV3L1/SUV3